MSCLFLDDAGKSVVSKCLWFYSKCTAFNPQMALNSISWMPGVLESTVQHCVRMQAKIPPFSTEFDSMNYYFLPNKLYHLGGWTFRKVMRCRILEIDVEHIFAWLNQRWIILVFGVQAHLALASPCNSSDRFKIFIHETDLLFYFKLTENLLKKSDIHRGEK